MELKFTGIYKGLEKKESKTNKSYILLQVEQKGIVYNIPVFDEKIIDTSIRPGHAITLVYNYSYKNNKTSIYVIGVEYGK